jgi:transglutaminase-like putative cysteine protease
MGLLRVVHSTLYRHAGVVPTSWQVARLRPLDTPEQECLAFDLEISPEPTETSTRVDFFGNTQHGFGIRQPHTRLSVTATSTVRRRAPDLPTGSTTLATDAVVRATATAVAQDEPRLEQFRHPTRLVPDLDATRALAPPMPDAPRMPIVEWIAAVGERFRREFAFDPTATAVSTPLAIFMQQRRGVCQDFAHAFIACARRHGLAAAYVSGYLLTRPPEGQLRLRGADAMHAWVAVHLPGHGWLDYDPTNTCFADERYVVVARGRDYADVSPLRGFFRGGGTHTLFLGVTVDALAEDG